MPQLVRYFDWALVEQCFEYAECDRVLPFVRAGKAVLAVEYGRRRSAFASGRGSWA